MFNEFIYFLKTSSELENPLRKKITDKEFSKEFIRSKLGPGRTTNTISVIRSSDDVTKLNITKFPIILKPTHSSGRNLIVNNSSNLMRARNILKKWLEHDYFFQSFERNYLDLEKKIIIEEYLGEIFYIEGSVHCRDGEPKIISIIDRNSKARESYSITQIPLGVSLEFPLKKLDLTNYNFWFDLIKDCRVLSEDFSYIRVDFYSDGDRVIFGELTNLPQSGHGRFFPIGGEKIFSSYFFS